MTTTESIFHSCYLVTRLSLRYEMFRFIKNWVVTDCRHQSHNSLFNNKPKSTTQMGSYLLSKAELLASCKKAPKEMKLLPVFWNFFIQAWQQRWRSTLSSLVKIPQLPTQSFYELHLDIYEYLKQLWVCFDLNHITSVYYDNPPQKHNDNHMSWPPIFRVHESGLDPLYFLWTELTNRICLIFFKWTAINQTCDFKSHTMKMTM